MIPNISTVPEQKERRNAKTQFLLTGFTQDLGFRVFAFEHQGEDRIRTKHTVRADLALVRRYAIRLQELPLLCKSLLERSDNGAEASTLTYTEAEMCVYAKDCAVAREAQKRKQPRKPASENIGSAWRGPQPQ